MNTRIVAGGCLSIFNADQKIINQVLKDNTYDNPKYLEARRLKRRTIDIPRLIASYRKISGGYVLPRGYLADLFQKYPKLYPKLQDKRTTSPVDFPMLDGITLREYQAPAINAALKFDQGMIVAPTGSGKTILGLELLHRRSQRALIFVHSMDLANQWAKEINKLLGIKAGIIGNSRWDEGSIITIALIQTLEKNPQKTQLMAMGYGSVLIDECHHIPADSFAKVINWIPTKFRYGLTATAHRGDGLHVMINRNIGRKICEIHIKDVEDSGGVVPAVVKVVKTEFSPNRVKRWNDYLDQIIKNPDRNKIIADVACCEAQNAPTLVLVDRVEHAANIAEFCSIKPLIIHGKLSKTKRKLAQNKINKAPLTIGTTGLLGEGIDVPAWTTLIIASPMSGLVRISQAIGRVIRSYQDKKYGIIVDFLDNHPIALSSFKKRVEVYRERKYKRVA